MNLHTCYRCRILTHGSLHNPLRCWLDEVQHPMLHFDEKIPFSVLMNSWQVTRPHKSSQLTSSECNLAYIGAMKACMFGSPCCLCITARTCVDRGDRHDERQCARSKQHPPFVKIGTGFECFRHIIAVAKQNAYRTNYQHEAAKCQDQPGSA